MKNFFLIVTLALNASAAANVEAAIVKVDIPDAAVSHGFGSGSHSVTYGGVKFSQSAALSNGYFWFVNSADTGYVPVLSSQEQTIGVANILVTLPVFAEAISISFGSFDIAPVTFKLSSGAVTVQNSSGGTYGTPDTFISGLSTAFNSVQLTSPDGIFDVSSITYTTADSVPEPATWALMLAGFGVVGQAMRRRARYAVAY